MVSGPGRNDDSAVEAGVRDMETTYVYTRGIPIEAQYLYAKALEASDHEKYEAALRYFRQAVIIAPRFSKAFCGIGNCLEKLGQYHEAVAVYDRALSVDPHNTDAQARRDSIIHKQSPDAADRNSRARQPFFPNR